MGFILSYCYYYFHKRLISVNNLRSAGINIEEWGGDNYFFFNDGGDSLRF